MWGVGMATVELEDLVSLSDAARLIPPLSVGASHPHAKTLKGWATDGVCGVRLWTTRIGPILVTSKSAIAAFTAEVRAARDTARSEGRRPRRASE